ncbi:TPA: GIY-YIG nuclease family protein [Escherichia coli]|nr:GIY-YIG nuclease family protein [Escherichia coli]HCJ9509015.1 GIY-YIG nuclease family protein [Escherichia coli]
MAILYILTFVKGEEQRRYIGETTQFKKRLRRHLKELRQGKHHNWFLQKAWDEGFVFDGNPTLIRCASKAEARSREQEQIALDQSFVNIENYYDCITNHPRRDEIIAKMSETIRLRYESMSDSERKKVYGKLGKLNGMFGKTHSAETREKIRQKIAEWYLTNDSPNLGRMFSDEHRKKISLHASGRVGEKNSFFGKTHSDETRKRIAEKKLGSKPPNIRPVIIDDVVYESITDAGRKLGKSPSVVLWRIKSENPKYTAWQWLDKCPTTRT